jgi:lactoylglutathione lyase
VRADADHEVETPFLAKLIHTMIRVLDLERSFAFYSQAFDMRETHRLDFPDFLLVYLRGADTDAEIELTVNKGRSESYSHGSGYGHVGFAVKDIEDTHKRFETLGLAPTALKEFRQTDILLARFFFVVDPDGYKIEVLERAGHYQ